VGGIRKESDADAVFFDREPEGISCASKLSMLRSSIAEKVSGDSLRKRWLRERPPSVLNMLFWCQWILKPEVTSEFPVKRG